MLNRRFIAPAFLILALPLMLLLVAACGSDEEQLTRVDVEEIVQEAIDSQPEGVTADQVDSIVRAALEEQQAEFDKIARDVVAGIPLKSDQAEYTKFFVENAIRRYDREGAEATLEYYSREESIEDQWYVFIIDEDDLVVAHPDPGRIGLDMKGWVGTDANGYVFGPEMLSATEEGKWVSYVYQNPAMGSMSPGNLASVQLKNAWVVRHDGLLFASGWYIDVDQLTQDIVEDLAMLFNDLGLEGTIEFLISNPESIPGGVAGSAEAYNASGAVEGEWSAFISGPDGTVALHFNPERIGDSVTSIYGEEVLDVSPQGTWLTSETKRVWALNSNNWIIGAGWVDEDGS